jgi:hypothetical protein
VWCGHLRDQQGVLMTGGDGKLLSKCVAAQSASSCPSVPNVAAKPSPSTQTIASDQPAVVSAVSSDNTSIATLALPAGAAAGITFIVSPVADSVYQAGSFSDLFSSGKLRSPLVSISPNSIVDSRGGGITLSLAVDVPVTSCVNATANMKVSVACGGFISIVIHTSATGVCGVGGQCRRCGRCSRGAFALHGVCAKWAMLLHFCRDAFLHVCCCRNAIRFLCYCIESEGRAHPFCFRGELALLVSNLLHVCAGCSDVVVLPSVRFAVTHFSEMDDAEMSRQFDCAASFTFALAIRFCCISYEMRLQQKTRNKLRRRIAFPPAFAFCRTSRAAYRAGNSDMQMVEIPKILRGRYVKRRTKKRWAGTRLTLEDAGASL